MSYVGTGQGEYIQETTYKYVGCGGDFSNVRPRRDFTCLICIPLGLLLLIPLLLWLLSGSSTSLPFNCQQGLLTGSWTEAQKAVCCATENIGCPTTSPEIVTQPPTPLPTPPPTPLPTPPPTPIVTRPTRPPPIGDPFNCAIDVVAVWGADKKAWCCRVHHIGCPTVAPPVVIPVTPCMTAPPAPADPYNCEDGFANWQAGWSVGKKAWCCKVHSKGCPQVGGCVTTSPPYDCNAGFANWQAGWSVAKKAWCCQNGGKGCPPAAGGC
jgi:hypothetical protein